MAAPPLVGSGLALAGTALVVALGGAGAASAAEVRTDHACYLDGQLNITATGLAPNDSTDYDVWVDGSYYGTLGTDGAGRASYSQSLERESDPPIRTKRVQIRQGTRVLAATSFLQTPLSVSPEIVGYTRPTGRVRLRAYGFVGSRKLYAHYAHNGRLYRTVAIGALASPCGTLSKTVAKFPFRPVPAGGWQIQFDGRRGYKRADAIDASFPLVAQETSVTKTIGKRHTCKRSGRQRRCSRR
jgi:hypothetical protein